MDDGHLDQARARIRDNPFYVLDLTPSATRVEVEREGQKLLDMLKLDLASAATYPTPLGAAQRTPEKVRQAMSELRDPEKRALHEIWAQLPAREIVAPKSEQKDDRLAPWPNALRALGWGR